MFQIKFFLTDLHILPPVVNKELFYFFYPLTSNTNRLPDNDNSPCFVYLPRIIVYIICLIVPNPVLYDFEWLNKLEKTEIIESVNRNIVDSFIKNIFVDNEKGVDIIYRYSDQYKLAEMYLKKQNDVV